MQNKISEHLLEITDAIKQYEQTEANFVDESYVLMGPSAGALTTALLTTDAQSLNQA